MIQLKFELGEKVRVKSNGRTGEITQTKHETYVLYGKKYETNRYGVNLGSFYTDWYDESMLEPFMSYEFTDKFEEGLCDFLIDTYLKHKQFHSLKKLSEQKYS
jgi:hypothetical protein